MTAVKIVATLRARPGRTEALLALLDGLIAQSRAEPGILRFDLWRDQDDDRCFVLDELYTDAAAVEAHRGTAHFLQYRAALEDLADRSSLVLDPVAVSEDGSA